MPPKFLNTFFLKGESYMDYQTVLNRCLGYPILAGVLCSNLGIEEDEPNYSPKFLELKHRFFQFGRQKADENLSVADILIMMYQVAETFDDLLSVINNHYSVLPTNVQMDIFRKMALKAITFRNKVVTCYISTHLPDSPAVREIVDRLIQDCQTIGTFNDWLHLYFENQPLSEKHMFFAPMMTSMANILRTEMETLK